MGDYKILHFTESSLNVWLIQFLKVFAVFICGVELVFPADLVEEHLLLNSGI